MSKIDSSTAEIAALKQELAMLKRLKTGGPQGTGKGALAQVDTKGKFVRKESTFRDEIKKGGKYPPESGRYVLYVSYACPWASRCLAVLHLKNLDNHVEICKVHPTWQRTKPSNPLDGHIGWVFVDPKDEKTTFSNTAGYGRFGAMPNTTVDTVNGFRTIREVYDSQKDKYTHTYSVPILYDKKTKSIVCNESAQIIEFFNKEFNDLSGVKKELDLSPVELKKDMEEVNAWVYKGINNGVYKCGFAKSQEAYSEAFGELFEALDKCETILAKNRYICGKKLTMSDIRLFVTIIRFDEVYAVYFKTNGKLIREYPNILGWTRELYQIPAIAKSVDMAQIKQHYYTSHPNYNLYGVVPLGPSGMKSSKGDVMAIFKKPHGRDTI